ncbi:hypothetical protein OF83DRAFT_797809 [Amylostereum chailletii]|nr:hypothetical protein OF83DRAFT_797809 [Amylostereum chailletii]
MSGQNFAKVAHGPIFIGTILNVVLYGISIAQTYIYLTTYKRDRLWMKLVVGVVFLADTLNAVFDIEYTYNSLVNHYNDPAAIQKANWVFATGAFLHLGLSTSAHVFPLIRHTPFFLIESNAARSSPPDPAMTSIIGTIVQLFFAWRVKVLTGSNITVAILVVGAVISCLGGIATSIAIGIVPRWLEFQKFEIPVIIWLTVSALVDTTITAIMVWHLRKHKRGFKLSDDLLDKIIRLTVQTGMLTSVWAIVDLCVYLSIPTGIHLIFNLPLSKLYSNSLLSSLNSRAGWKYATNSEETSSTGGQSRRPDVVTFGSTAIRPEVYIDVESHEMMHVDDKPNNKMLSESSSPSSIPTPRVGGGGRPTSVVKMLPTTK